MSLFRLKVWKQNEAGSTNERKRVAWDDVTKRFLFHKAAVLTTSLDSFKHWNIKYVINISSAYIVSALLWLRAK